MEGKAPVSFENTEIAFKRYSDKELKMAKMLFGMFNFKPVVRFAPPITSFALKIGLPIKGMVRATIFEHFCGGESINDCDQSVRILHENRIGAILDYSVEGEQDEEDFVKNFHEIQGTIDKAADSASYPFAVFKPTGIGRFSIYEKVNTGLELNEKENREYDSIKGRFKALCQRAHDKNVPLFIDAEESWVQDCFDALVESMMEEYNKEQVIIFNTVQLYRKGRIDYMNGLYTRAKTKGFKVGLKLVRGAYMEKERERALEKGYPSPIQDTKADSDKDYNRAVELCFEHKEHTKVCVGTHNEDSALLVVKLLNENNLKPNDDRFWFAQLYGMSDHISFNLANAGYNVAKYLPYGPIVSVLPYLSRRAQENSSVAGQAGREISLIKKELIRRRRAR